MQQNHRRYNEKLNGSFITEKYSNFKNSVNRLNNRMKGTEGRIIEFEDRTISYLIWTIEKIRLEIMIRASGAYETLIKDWVFVPLESQKDRKIREWGWISTGRDNDWKHPRFGIIHTFLDLRNWVYSKQNKPRESHTKIHHSQTSENQRQRKKSWNHWKTTPYL